MVDLLPNNFPLRTAFPDPRDFRMLCFHFHLFLGNFWFPLWFLHLPSGCLIACCLASTCFFPQFFLVIDLLFHTVLIRKDTWYDFNVLKLIETSVACCVCFFIKQFGFYFKICDSNLKVFTFWLQKLFYSNENFSKTPLYKN